MPRRHWLPVVAVAGFVALAVRVDAQTVGGDSGGEASADQSQPQPPEYREPVDLLPVQDLLDRIAGAIEAANDQEEPPHEYDRAEADLDAQERMAFWAMGMFWATLAAVLLTAVGIILIWRTLIHTRRAADYTAEMLVQAKESTKAAVVAAEAAQDTVRSDRAWLVPHGFITAGLGGAFVDGEPVENGIGIVARWSNAGRSPALRSECEAYSKMLSASDPIPQFSPRSRVPGEMQRQAPVGPGGGVTSDMMAFSDAESDQIRAGAVRLVVWSRVEYSDIHQPETRHHTELCVLVDYNGEITENGVTRPNFRFAPIGPQNTAT